MSLGRSIHSRGVGGLKIGMGLYAGWSGKEAVGSTVVSSGLGLGFLVVDGGGAVEIVILKMVKKLVFQTIFNTSKYLNFSRTSRCVRPALSRSFCYAFKLAI